MANWKKFEDTGGNRIDVNLDNVSHATFYSEDQSAIYFIGSDKRHIVKGSVSDVSGLVEHTSSSKPLGV
jgi:hypothetical protein